MTLSKKNPLRLMLPSDTSEGTDSGLHPQTETTAQSIYVSATGPSFVFDLLEPSGIQAQKSEHLALPQTILVNDDDQEKWLEPLPFSTPGPGSLLGSSVASNNIDLSLPKKDLSTVSYANETYIGSNLPSNPSRSHTLVNSSDFLPSDPYIEIFAMDEVGSSWEPLMPEEDSQSLFSNIYSTSGPHYCAPRPVHFDSPLEDPMSSDHLQPGYEIDYDTIDFHWKPFDRKNIVVFDRLQKPIYASRPVHSNGAFDNSEYEHAVKLVKTETNTLNPYIFPGPASPLLSISPTPFRFLVPPESDAPSSVPNPKSQNQNTTQIPSTPKKSPYFEVPGIYISPLDEHRKVHDTVSNVHRLNIIQCFTSHGSQNYPARHHDEYAGDSVEQTNSQGSKDSIESWEQKLY